MSSLSDCFTDIDDERLDFIFDEDDNYVSNSGYTTEELDAMMQSI